MKWKLGLCRGLPCGLMGAVPVAVSAPSGNGAGGAGGNGMPAALLVQSLLGGSGGLSK